MFVMMMMVRINYYIATVWPKARYLLGDEDGQKVNHLFDVALPRTSPSLVINKVGGIVSMPIVGTLLDNFSTATVLGVLVVVSSIIGVLQITPNLIAQYATVLIFAIYRPLYYTAISDYCAKVFGFKTFGKVYGIPLTLINLGAMICIAGVFNLIQEVLDHLVNSEVFNGNPVPVDTGLLIVSVVVGGAIWAHVGVQSRRLKIPQIE